MTAQTYTIIARSLFDNKVLDLEYTFETKAEAKAEAKKLNKRDTMYSHEVAKNA